MQQLGNVTAVWSPARYFLHAHNRQTTLYHINTAKTAWKSDAFHGHDLLPFRSLPLERSVSTHT